MAKQRWGKMVKAYYSAVKKYHGAVKKYHSMAKVKVYCGVAKAKANPTVRRKRKGTTVWQK